MSGTPDRVLQAAARAALLAEVDRVGAVGADPVRGSRPALRAGLALLIAGATIAAGWLGVIAAQRHHSPPVPAISVPAPSVTSAPSPTGSVDPDDRLRALIGQVEGSGSLTGPITGRFTITYEYGTPILHLTDLRVGTSTARQVVVAVDLASATCAAQKVGTQAGTITAKPVQTDQLQDSSAQTYSDLSYMSALAIWPQDMGCVADRVSAGTIHWTLPAGLRALARTDLGGGAGARGAVVLTEGRPARYTVASNDRIEAVAARFGLTVNELLYLNPLRDRGNDQQLYAGETLNLNPLDRAYFSNTGF